MFGNSDVSMLLVCYIRLNTHERNPNYTVSVLGQLYIEILYRRHGPIKDYDIIAPATSL